jgi:hypothetical protein
MSTGLTWVTVWSPVIEDSLNDSTICFNDYNEALAYCKYQASYTNSQFAWDYVKIRWVIFTTSPNPSGQVYYLGSPLFFPYDV